MKSFFGLLGESLGHSVSPVIHKYIFEILDISAYYHLIEVERSGLQLTVEGLRRLGASGINVTIPYKTEVMQYLDYISPEAASIGAVNTIAFRDKSAEGYNTDYSGFGMLLDRYGIRIDKMEALVLGYGGGAKAVIRFLLDHEVKGITVAVRNARSRATNVNNSSPDNVLFVDYQELPLQKGGDLIINCTPCGMHPHIEEIPVSVDVLRKYHTAVDLIYNPEQTKFLKHADKAGLKAVNGLYMLVGQAVTAQNIWNKANLSNDDIDRIYNKITEYMRKQ